MNKPFDLRVLGRTVLLTICTHSDVSNVAELSRALATVLSQETEVIVLNLGRIFERSDDTALFLEAVKACADTTVLVVVGRDGPRGRLLVFAQTPAAVAGGGCREQQLREVRRVVHVRQLEQRALGMEAAAGSHDPC